MYETAAEQEAAHRRDARSGLFGLLTISAGVIGQRVVSSILLILQARWLLPEEFGQLSLATGLMLGVAQIPASIDVAFVALFQRTGGHGDDLRLAYRNVKTALAIAIATAGIAFVHLAEATVLHGIDVWLFDVAFAGAAAYTLFLSWPALLQAQERFAGMALVLLSQALAIFAASVLVRLAAPEAGPLAYLSAWVALTALGAVLAIAAIASRAPAHWPADATRKLLHFGKWLLVATLAYAALQTLDLLLLAGFGTSHELGLYSAGLRYAAIVAIGAGALMSVTLPSGAAVRTTRDLAPYARRWLIPACSLIALGLTLILLADPVLPLVLGQSYSGAVDVGQLLVAATLPMAVLIPLSNMLYGFDRPAWIAALNLVQLAALAGFGVALTPMFGPTGVALSVLFARCIAIIVTYVGIHQAVSASRVTP